MVICLPCLRMLCVFTACAFLSSTALSWVSVLKLSSDTHIPFNTHTQKHTHGIKPHFCHRNTHVDTMHILYPHIRATATTEETKPSPNNRKLRKRPHKHKRETYIGCKNVSFFFCWVAIFVLRSETHTSDACFLGAIDCWVFIAYLLLSVVHDCQA